MTIPKWLEEFLDAHVDVRRVSVAILDGIKAEIATALAEERERCARIIETTEWDAPDSVGGVDAMVAVLGEMIDRIRDGSAPPIKQPDLSKVFGPYEVVSDPDADHCTVVFKGEK